MNILSSVIYIITQLTFTQLKIKTPERRHWRRSDNFIVSLEHISHFFLVFLLLTLNKYVLAG